MGTARRRRGAVADLTAHGIEAMLVAFDIESVTGAPPCDNAYVAGLRARHPQTFIGIWGAIDPGKGEQAIADANRPYASMVSPASTSTRSWASSPSTTLRSGPCSRRSPARRPGPDRRRDHRDGRGPARRHGNRLRHAHPRPWMLAANSRADDHRRPPGWPWADEMTAVALHKGNVYWEMSGWAPRYFPAQLRPISGARAAGQIMFGTDYPSIPFERLLREWDELGFSEDVMHQVFHAQRRAHPRPLVLAGKEPDMSQVTASRTRHRRRPGALAAAPRWPSRAPGTTW